MANLISIEFIKILNNKFNPYSSSVIKPMETNFNNIDTFIKTFSYVPKLCNEKSSVLLCHL